MAADGRRVPQSAAECRRVRPSAPLIRAHGHENRVHAECMLIGSLIRTHGHEKLARWLEGARQWPSELHHVGALPWARVRHALRAGADLHLRATDTSPSPLELASEIASEIARELTQHGADSCALVGGAGGAEGRGHHRLPGTGASLVLAAARPWSRETHELWPTPHREWAAAVVRLGQSLAWHSETPDRLPLAEVC